MERRDIGGRRRRYNIVPGGDAASGTTTSVNYFYRLNRARQLLDVC